MHRADDALRAAMAKAAELEREACARVADDYALDALAASHSNPVTAEVQQELRGRREVAEKIAEAIRGRRP